MSFRKSLPQHLLHVCLLAAAVTANGQAEPTARVASPNGKNAIAITVRDNSLVFEVVRNDQVLMGPSRFGPELVETDLYKGIRMAKKDTEDIDETFPLYWGKTGEVHNHGSSATLTFENSKNIRWQVEIRAYDDGVAFRYLFPLQDSLPEFTVKGETTRFQAVGFPSALYNILESYTTSHETNYEKKPIAEVAVGKLIDCPLLLEWQNGPAAAITEARVRDYAGMYLERGSKDSTSLDCRLSPHPKLEQPRSVAHSTPAVSPWRVVLLADRAGELLESNLLLCLNDAPKADFTWARPGKSTFHWWYGEFEDDHKLPNEREVYVARHRKYIDFCADNNIAYHSLSGDGFAWYKQSRIDYGVAADDADVRVARSELGLPEIIAYAKERGVGMRLWVHWKALDMHLEEAMQVYESWGIKGLMVDFLDRDDQEMLEYVDRMLDAAARHKIHIQIHGSSKYSGEQRTYPNLFNREGVLNLEYSKWSKLCTPAHAVNVAYTRALAGPVDFHLGGLRCRTREEFEPRDRAPHVMGTRCHHLALYVVYENPMPMVADAPHEYENRKGFEFIRDVPTTWDETRFLVGEAGEYIVLARRKGKAWYLGGITNWTAREVSVPMDFLEEGTYKANGWFDASNAGLKPNELTTREETVDNTTQLRVKMATGGGFVAVLRPAVVPQ